MQGYAGRKAERERQEARGKNGKCAVQVRRKRRKSKHPVIITHSFIDGS